MKIPAVAGVFSSNSLPEKETEVSLFIGQSLETASLNSKDRCLTLRIGAYNEIANTTLYNVITDKDRIGFNKETNSYNYNVDTRAGARQKWQTILWCGLESVILSKFGKENMVRLCSPVTSL